jgi:hypothetical protein
MKIIEYLPLTTISLSYNQGHMLITTLPKILLYIASLNMLCRKLLLVLVIMPGTTPLAWAAPTYPGDEDLARLKQGEILLETIHSDKSGGAARVTGMFYSKPGVVWDIIGHCNYAIIYMRGLSLCEMLEGNQFRMTMHHRLRSSWYTPTLDYTFMAKRGAEDHGEAYLIEGNLKVLEANWNISSATDGNGIIVVHEIRIQPKLPAPRWLIRRSLRKDLPDMLACIRGLARASGGESRILADLRRCSGEISNASK